MGIMVSVLCIFYRLPCLIFYYLHTFKAYSPPALPQTLPTTYPYSLFHPSSQAKVYHAFTLTDSIIFTFSFHHGYFCKKSWARTLMYYSSLFHFVFWLIYYSVSMCAAPLILPSG